MTIGFYSSGQRFKAAFGIGQVVKHADRKRIIKGLSQRQVINIGLYNVNVRQLAGRGKRAINSVAKVYPNNFCCTPLSRKLRMTTLATASFKYDLVAKEVWFHRL